MCLKNVIEEDFWFSEICNIPYIRNIQFNQKNPDPDQGLIRMNILSGQFDIPFGWVSFTYVSMIICPYI